MPPFNEGSSFEKCFSVEEENNILKYLWSRNEKHLYENGITDIDVKNWLEQQKK